MNGMNEKKVKLKTSKVQMCGYYNWVSDNSLNKRRPKLEILKKKQTTKTISISLKDR